jgi:O-antigen/teichoic acid export membrane protein
MKLKKYLIIIFCICIYNFNSFAYFDPGTGGHILQAVLSFISLIIFYFFITVSYIKNFFRRYLRKIKLLFSKDRQNKNKL